MSAPFSGVAHRPEEPAAKSVAALIKAEAAGLGFDLAGVAPAVTPPGFPSFLDWLDRGYAGEMHYLPQRREAYSSPQSVMDGVRSIVMLAISYHQSAERTCWTAPSDKLPVMGRVASYAEGNSDYHDVIRDKLNRLALTVEKIRPGCRTRGIVDTAPLLERDFARLAGLGWFGKNTMLLNRRLGSWFFLAALLVDVELDYDTPHVASHCGTCTRCLDACPTDAFVGPYVLDANRCISYLTIEHRGAVPAELREGMGDWLFGCDVCQDVCPWNRKAAVSEASVFGARSRDESGSDSENVGLQLDPLELLSLDEAGFRARFRKTPLWRPKRVGLLRNACLVLGNRGDSRAVPRLVGALQDEEPVIRGAAAWALGKIRTSSAVDGLIARAMVELEPGVREELAAALRNCGAECSDLRDDAY